MKTTLDWINEAEQRFGLTDYAMAKKLGVSTAQMSRYRTQKSYLGDDTAIRLAALLEVDPLPILAAAAAERATTDQARDVWSKYAEALAGLAGAAVLSGALITVPVDARASTPRPVTTQVSDVYYVNQ